MRYWVGFDVGKAFHWVCVLDEGGEVVLSRRAEATERDLEACVEEIVALGGDRFFGIDLLGGPAALLEAVLLVGGERVFHLPGTAVNRARGGYRGEQESDRGDARLIARPRALLLEVFPGPEAALDLRKDRALLAVTRVATPSAARRPGISRLARWLRARGVRRCEEFAGKVVEAAEVLRARGRIADLDARLEELMAAAAGLVPATRQSGGASFRRRARRGNRTLKNLLYRSAFGCTAHHGPSRTYYLRKRAEGKAHHQAVIALARRRVNAPWATLRDGRPYVEQPAKAA